MSAGQRWHEDAPTNKDEPILPLSSLSWIWSSVSRGNSALHQDPLSGLDGRPPAAPDDTPEDRDTLATLLRAIHSTEVAIRFGAVARPDNRPVPSPAPANSAKAPKATSTKANAAASAFKPPAADPPFPAAWRIPPMLNRTSTFFVQTPPYSASARLMPLRPTSPRPPLPATSPSPVHPLHASPSDAGPTAVSPQPPILEVWRIAQTTKCPSTYLVQTHPLAAPTRLMPPAAAVPPRLAPATPPGIPHPLPISIAPPLPSSQPAAASEPAPTIISPRPLTCIDEHLPPAPLPAFSSSEINHLAAIVISALENMRRVGMQLSIARKNWIATRAFPIIERLGRAGAHVSAGLRNCFGPRRSVRLAKPPLVAWCWTADTQHSLHIADISAGGLHLLTDVRWPLGGKVPIALERTDRSKHSPGSWIVADFVVLRWCKDGLAGALVPPSRYSFVKHAENRADERALKRFVKHLDVRALR
jgi:hypothetical protein